MVEENVLTLSSNIYTQFKKKEKNYKIRKYLQVFHCRYSLQYLFLILIL